MKPRVLFVSVHLGPYLSLAPLEDEFGASRSLFLVEGPSQQSRQQSCVPYWTLAQVIGGQGGLSGFLREKQVQAIMCGTSDGLPDGNLEELARGAATECGVPVFAVEDFPGNYHSYARTRLDGLFVESRALEKVYEARGVATDRIHCLGNPRYDHLHTINRAHIRGATRAILNLGDDPAVLWAGQPDGENSLRTLERMLPSLTAHRIDFLFKAHPRDELYRAGAYQPVLSQLKSWRDISGWTETTSLCCAVDLVLTQFSSVGVEASYLGTPVVFVLFDDLGKASLKQSKGYEIVPWVQAGSAFFIDSFSDVREVVGRALWDSAARVSILGRFHEQFGGKQASAQAIASAVRGYLVGCV